MKIRIIEQVLTEKKDIIDKIKSDILSGKAVDAGTDNVYQILRVNSDNFKMPTSLISKLKDEGLFDNSYIGVIYPKSEKLPLDSNEWLPTLGSSTHVTKWFKNTPNEAFSNDLRDSSMKLKSRLFNNYSSPSLNLKEFEKFLNKKASVSPLKLEIHQAGDTVNITAVFYDDTIVDTNIPVSYVSNEENWLNFSYILNGKIEKAIQTGETFTGKIL